MQIETEFIPKINTLPHGRIYKLTNKINGTPYVGQTIEENINDRWAKYKGLHCKSQKKLYRALKKYGWDNFLAEVIDTTSQNQAQLDDLEIFYIAKFDSMNNGYNCDPGGRGGKKSEETKRRISESSKGKIMSEESRQKMSKAKMGKLHPMFGKRGKLVPAFGKTGELSSMYGKHHTDESKKKMSNSHKGNKNPNFGKRGELAPMFGRCNESHPFFGKSHSEETKQKMREGHAKRKRELLTPSSKLSNL